MLAVYPYGNAYDGTACNGVDYPAATTIGPLKQPVVVGRKPTTSMQSFSPTHYVTGHVAALYNDELYDTVRGNSGRAHLQMFGVIVGYDQVVIYVEPLHAGVTTNTARTQLIIDGEEVPWESWAGDSAPSQSSRRR